MTFSRFSSLMLRCTWTLAFLLSVVLPVLAVLVVLWQTLSGFGMSEDVRGLLFFGIFCFTILPGVVYWFILFERFVPKTFRSCFLFFIPFLLSVALSLRHGPLTGMLDSFILHSTASFLGLYAGYLVGLLGLLKLHSGVQELMQSAFSLVLAAVFLSLLATLFLIWKGGSMLAPLYSFWSVGGYFLEGIAAFAVFYPRLKVLYKEKRL